MISLDGQLMADIEKTSIRTAIVYKNIYTLGLNRIDRGSKKQ